MAINTLRQLIGGVAAVHRLLQDLERSEARRAEAEEALLASQERFRTLTENASDGIVIAGADGTILYESPAVERIIGYKPEEVVGTNAFDFIHPDDQLGVMQSSLDFLPNPGATALQTYRFRHKDGSWRLLQVVAQNLLHDPKVRGILANYWDITERQQAEDALRESEEKYRLIADNTGDYIVVTTLSGECTYASPSYRKLGHCPEEMLGRNCLDFIYPEDRELLVPLSSEYLRETIEERLKTKHLSYRIGDLDGNWHDMETTMNFVRGSGEDEWHIILTSRDVTERKRRDEELGRYALALATKNAELDAARERLGELNRRLEDKVAERTAEVRRLIEQKDQFIGRMGHDLKSPLTPLLALLPLIIEREQDDDKREMLIMILQNATFMRDLVTNVLKLARMGAQPAGEAVECLNLAKVVESVLTARKATAAEKGVTTRCSIDGNLIVHADGLALQEVIDNLVGNSLKFTPDGGQIDISAQQDCRFVTVSVTDTGAGMTQEQLAHVFDEFYKADPSRSDAESSGLGLSICKRIIERGGGRIWAESPGLGRGASFRFTLEPAESVEPAVALASSAPSEMP
jgi:PAS domain S-box-containing protein